MAEEGACQIGTANCSCNASFPCVDEGFACVDGTCQMCNDGEEGCPCLDGDVCSAGLECFDPDPTCTFQCEPSTCEAPGGSSAEDTGSTDGGGGTCEPADLCTRTIDECMVDIDMPSCLAFYDGGMCADIAAYTACNCDCITAATCDEYFACGNLCFNNAC